MKFNAAVFAIFPDAPENYIDPVQTRQASKIADYRLPSAPFLHVLFDDNNNNSATPCRISHPRISSAVAFASDFVFSCSYFSLV